MKGQTGNDISAVIAFVKHRGFTYIKIIYERKIKI
jgi:hypothetical protein